MEGMTLENISSVATLVASIVFAVVSIFVVPYFRGMNEKADKIQKEVRTSIDGVHDELHKIDLTLAQMTQQLATMEYMRKRIHTLANHVNWLQMRLILNDVLSKEDFERSGIGDMELE